MTENSTQTENYLKAIWNAAEWSTQPVTVSVLAARLGLAASSVSEAVRKLTARGLVTHAPYSAIALSAEGEHCLDCVLHNALECPFPSRVTSADYPSVGVCQQYGGTIST